MRGRQKSASPQAGDRCGLARSRTRTLQARRAPHHFILRIGTSAGGRGPAPGATDVPFNRQDGWPLRLSVQADRSLFRGLEGDCGMRACGRAVLQATRGSAVLSSGPTLLSLVFAARSDAEPISGPRDIEQLRTLKSRRASQTAVFSSYHAVVSSCLEMAASCAPSSREHCPLRRAASSDPVATFS